MPVSPVGNMNFINQNMTYVATQVSNEIAKHSFAASLNMAAFNEKEKILSKLEKVVQSNEIQEEIGEKTKQEQERRKQREHSHEEQEQKSEEKSMYRLDMSV